MLLLERLARNWLEEWNFQRKGSSVLRYWRILERTQYDSPEVIEARQFVALRAIIRHAYDSVPYYRDLFELHDLHPDAIRTPADFSQIPILTKADIRENFQRLQSERIPRAHTVDKTTSGSTGVPLRVRVDRRSVEWKTACTMRSDQWSGWRRGEPVAKVWGNPEYKHYGLKGWLHNCLFENAIYLDTLKMDRAAIDSFIRSCLRVKPTLIFGHAHSVYLFAQELEARGVELRPKGVITTAMPLHEWQRTVIERVLDCKVINRYGCEEVSLIASQCEYAQGLHVNADNLYTEVIPDMQTGPEAGRLILTDLTNYAMPLIRYQVGDVVTIAQKKCPCGRGMPEFAAVMGREADYVITPEGQYISGISLTENFALHIPHVAQLQIVQETPNFFTFRIVRAKGFGPESMKALRDKVYEIFGSDVKYDVDFVEAIPQEPSGKYRFCISKVTHPPLRAAG